MYLERLDAHVQSWGSNSILLMLLVNIHLIILCLPCFWTFLVFFDTMCILLLLILITFIAIWEVRNGRSELLWAVERFPFLLNTVHNNWLTYAYGPSFFCRGEQRGSWRLQLFNFYLLRWAAKFCGCFSCLNRRLRLKLVLKWLWLGYLPGGARYGDQYLVLMRNAARTLKGRLWLFAAPLAQLRLKLKLNICCCLLVRWQIDASFDFWRKSLACLFRLFNLGRFNALYLWHSCDSICAFLDHFVILFSMKHRKNLWSRVQGFIWNALLTSFIF